MPAYWMISNRVMNGKPGTSRGALTYWISNQAPLNNFKNWKQVSVDDFKKLLVGAADEFPDLSHDSNEGQKHVTLFIHGYNNGWDDAAKRYQKLCADLYSGDNGLGLCISFDWPSLANVLGYYPDRAQARESADDLANVFSQI